MNANKKTNSVTNNNNDTHDLAGHCCSFNNFPIAGEAYITNEAWIPFDAVHCGQFNRP